MNIWKFAAAIGISTLMLFSTSVGSIAGETHVVEMLNKHPTDKKKRMVYLPAVVYAKPGDTIKFVSKSKGHNVESMKGMLPDGAEKWKSRLSKDFELTLSKPGVYGYRCTPHYGAGMVGLIVVEGDGVKETLETAKKVRTVGRAKRVFKELFAEVEAKLASGS
ncbi:MAG: pseudoazurin [Pseudomonadota bacterium]